MNLGIAGGKGGTGKTTITINLALSLDRKIQLFDLDVEEPNLNIFLKRDLNKIKEVNKKAPNIDSKKCSHCQKCSDKCQFNALAILENKEIVYEDLCHGCGLCKIVCPQEAIEEKNQKIGIIKQSEKENLNFYQGELEIGKALSTPIIKELKKQFKKKSLSIYDIPPGTDCLVIESFRDLDYCILVTEPTPFGLNDLKRSVNVLKTMNIPFGVIINRYQPNYQRIQHYCQDKNIKILLKIPNSKKIAKKYSNAEPFIKDSPKWKKKFRKVFKEIKNERNHSN